jgi:adenine deaminase
LGFDPIDAICMGTINPATCFGFKHLGAIAAGHQASFIVLDQLSNFKINQVYVKGEPFKPAPSYTKSELNNHKQYYSKVKVNFDVLDKKLKSTKLDKPTDCIKIIPNTLLTKCLTVDKNTKFIVNKIVNIERHKFGNNIGTGFVCDFNIINGAIGTTIGHDSHNMIIIGSDNENIKLAAKALQKCSGGYVLVKNQQVLQSLSLPIGGLLSDLKPSEVMKNECLLHKSFSQIMKNDYKNPLLDMSFLSLTVIPEIRITPHGMIKSKI